MRMTTAKRIDTPITGGDRPCAACDGTGVA